MILKAVAVAFQFLTIIPIQTKSISSEKEVYSSVSYFPLVGATQGLFLALSAYFLLKIMPADITAVIVLSFYAMITGGFHQDGLSDTFDALSIKSCGNGEIDREKRLRVMKDSTVGPTGVMVIVFSLLLKYLLLKEILGINNCMKGYSLFFLMPVLSKWAMVITMYHTRSARTDGIGRIFLEHTGLKQIVYATILLVIFCIVWCLFLYFLLDVSQQGAVSGTLFFFLEMISIYPVCLILKHLFTIKFNGLTGDNFGAIHEISEILFLTIALLWR